VKIQIVVYMILRKMDKSKVQLMFKLSYKVNVKIMA
jgi:hypothetical protein